MPDPKDIADLTNHGGAFGDAEAEKDDIADDVALDGAHDGVSDSSGDRVEDGAEDADAAKTGLDDPDLDEDGGAYGIAAE